jgi:phosphoribosylanthranilate isomerase
LVKVKICGLTNAEDVLLAAKAGADALGFVVEVPVKTPRNLSRSEARRLMDSAPPFISTVAVMMPEDPSRAIELALFLRPSTVQLHGDETLSGVATITSELKRRGIKVVKSLVVDPETGEASFEITDPVAASKELMKAGVHALLLDKPKSSPKRDNWSIAKEIRKALEPFPLIVAGDLTPSNVADCVSFIRPYAVDVARGVESRPGKKDPVKVLEFIKRAKQAGE